MSKELIAINLAAYRRIALTKMLYDRADEMAISRTEIPIPLTCADGEQPTWNDIAAAAARLRCTAVIADIRFYPDEKIHD